MKICLAMQSPNCADMTTPCYGFASIVMVLRIQLFCKLHNSLNGCWIRTIKILVN